MAFSRSNLESFLNKYLYNIKSPSSITFKFSQACSLYLTKDRPDDQVFSFEQIVWASSSNQRQTFDKTQDPQSLADRDLPGCPGHLHDLLGVPDHLHDVRQGPRHRWSWVLEPAWAWLCSCRGQPSLPSSSYWSSESPRARRKIVYIQPFHMECVVGVLHVHHHHCRHRLHDHHDHHHDDQSPTVIINVKTPPWWVFYWWEYAG